MAVPRGRVNCLGEGEWRQDTLEKYGIETTEYIKVPFCQGIGEVGEARNPTQCPNFLCTKGIANAGDCRAKTIVLGFVKGRNSVVKALRIHVQFKLERYWRTGEQEIDTGCECVTPVDSRCCGRDFTANGGEGNPALLRGGPVNAMKDGRTGRTLEFDASDVAGLSVGISMGYVT
jgi:hypothetical protein